ncbi:hypothetical protein PAPHI01_0904 [Pancytospora philotis]|nr:hypothetical protein PAPHI01_0904 [Pancytospora philotis]
MLPGTILLQLVCCYAAERSRAAKLPAIVAADYNDFGKTSGPELNTLEKQVLGPLWRSCIGHTSPEIPFIDARMRACTTDEGTHCLVYSVLKDINQHDRPNRLLDRLLEGFGFSGHLLLGKLFYAVYAKHGAPAAGHSSETRNQLAMLIQKSSELLKKIIGEVGNKVIADRAMTLEQHARENEMISTATDYALSIRSSYALSKQGFTAELSRLFDYWFDDYERFARHFTTISKCISIVLQYNIIPRRKLPKFRDQLARHIIDKEQPKYLELLSSFMSPRDLKHLVSIYFDTYDFNSFSPHFVLNFIAYVPKTGGDAPTVISRTWDKYLKDAPTFLRRQTAFKNELFTKLPPFFLQEIFVYLKGLSADDPRRNSAISDFVGKLDCALFLRVIGKCEGIEEQNELMHFLLGYLDVDAVRNFTLYVNSEIYYKNVPKGRIYLASHLKYTLNTLALNRPEMAAALSPTSSSNGPSEPCYGPLPPLSEVILSCNRDAQGR